MRYAIAAWALVFSLPFATFAQTNQSAWTKLAALQPGTKIQVVDTAAKVHSGTFVNATDTAIDLRNTSSEQSIQKADVRQVKIVKNSNRGRHVLLLGAIGAGAGAGIGAAVKGSCGTGILCDTSPAKWAGAGAAVGAVVGAVVGALMPAHGGTTVYKASAP